MQELEQASEPKRTNMLALIEEYQLNILNTSPKIRCLGELYIEIGIIPASHLFDSLHVAIASVYELGCIISYNFRHINRDKTRIMTAKVNKEEGYGIIIIITAGEVLTDEF